MTRSQDFCLKRSVFFRFSFSEQCLVVFGHKIFARNVQFLRFSFLNIVLSCTLAFRLFGFSAFRLFSVLRMLSLGLSFRRSKCMVARVDSMLERIRDENINLLVQ